MSLPSTRLPKTHPPNPPNPGGQEGRPSVPAQETRKRKANPLNFPCFPPVIPSPAPPTSAALAFQRGVISETQGTIRDEHGETIWICPACKLPDDGSPMIGCDDCPDWYHWVCVGIKVEPAESDNWYCPRCMLKQKGNKKKKQRRKKSR